MKLPAQHQPGLELGEDDELVGKLRPTFCRGGWRKFGNLSSVIPYGGTQRSERPRPQRRRRTAASKSGREFARKPFTDALRIYLEERKPHVSERTTQFEAERLKPVAAHFGERPLLREGRAHRRFPEGPP